MGKIIKKISKDAKKTILFADDELENRRSLGEILVRSGYDVKFASEGETGFEIYRKFKPDLVLTDYRMPGMDGLELVKRIRKDDKFTPVLMLTAYGSVNAYLDALSAGVNYFINKPIKAEELLQVLEGIFNSPVENEEARIRKQNKYLHEIIQTLRADLARCKENKETEIVLDKYRMMMAATSHRLKSEFMHIGNSIKTLREKADNSANEIEEYEMMERSIQFSQLILRRLLDFVDMGKPNIEQIDVAKLIQKTVALVRPRLSSNIHLEVRFVPAAGGFKVTANDEQLMEVLVELVQNASTALRAKGGTIELRIEKRGDEIALSVKDNGQGVPEELKKELLTKEVKSKHGLGLGLYLSSKIINALDGKLILENTSEKGTIITILMPMVVNEKE